MTTILPPAVTQFSDANGAPLAGGSVTFYIPGTTTFKNTWQDASQIALNTNPVILDAAGEAIIYGLGAYRSVLKDSLGNLIWDQLTSSTDAGGIFSGGTSTGTAANQIVATTTPAGFSLTSGNQLTFVAGFSSTGATTLNANGTGAKNILKPGASGPVALVAGDIGVGDAVVVYYDGTQFQLVNPIALPLTGGNLTGTVNEAAFVTIASAGTTNISGAASNNVVVTGSGTITSLGPAISGARRTVFFQSGVATLVNSGTLVLPGLANIATAAGDVAEFKSQGGAWVCIVYTRASGLAVISAFTAKFDSTARTMVVLAGASSVVAHGLSQRPDSAIAVARCTTAEGGYSIGDEVEFPTYYQIWNGSSNVGAGAQVAWDATNVSITIATGVSSISFVNRATGATFTPTAANWALFLRAWY